MTNDPQPGIFIGMDEAGYGPNLGPLVLTATRWQTPIAPDACDFYGLLALAVDATSDHQGERLHLADSKLVHRGKSGFQSLERSALALLNCVGCDTRSYQSVVSHLSGRPMGEENVTNATSRGVPWFVRDATLPRSAARESVDRLSALLEFQMRACGVRLLDVRSDVVIEDRFNQLLDDCGSKGVLLSRLAFCLLREVWTPTAPGRTLFVGDKHGGRNRYHELLAEVLDGEMIFCLRESRDLSCYRVRETELRFQVQGERHLPVAAASIISKYLRELSMDLFNDFWREHCPDLQPTRGYPVDAIRFRREIEATRLELGLDERLFWRQR